MNQLELLLARLKGLPQTLGGAPGAPPSAPAPVQPGMPPPQGRGDIYLPPESGQLDPRLPAAHLPPALREQYLREAMLKGMKR